MRSVICFTGICLVLVSGCTHTQLRYNHTNSAKTLTNIYEKQVLDNLAMFVANKDAVPFFAVPEAGATQVTDSGALGATPLNGPLHTILSLNSLARNNFGSWSYKPITDPLKLKLMRCAYRRAIGLANPGDCCINCCQLKQEWEGSNDCNVCCSCCQIRCLKIEACGNGLLRPKCGKYGKYCGTIIRVSPESYDDLAQLVFSVLDYAVNTPQEKAPTPTAEVEHFHYKRDANDNYITDGQGKFVVDYIDKFTTDAHPFTASEETADGGTQKTTITPTASPAPSTRILRQRSELLDEQIRQQRRDTLLPRF